MTPEVAVGCAHPELVEEDVAQRRVEVLAGVDEDEVAEPVEALDHAAQPDDLRPRPEDREDFILRRIPG